MSYSDIDGTMDEDLAFSPHSLFEDGYSANSDFYKDQILYRHFNKYRMSSNRYHDNYSWNRFLADEGGEDSAQIDYSILSMYVVTLGLIMVVEVIRHKIDFSVLKRPFFRSVMEGVYAELSTLGIVELALFLYKSYFGNYLNPGKYEYFLEVHFALFYTAIFNAIQSVLVALAAWHVSRRSWVKTETLELNHYVEIREEFERVKEQLERLKQRRKQTVCDTISKKKEDEMASNNVKESHDTANEHTTTITNNVSEQIDDVVEVTRAGMRLFYQNVVDLIRFPKLKLSYDALLVQVRFHELRVHFLQSYKLPLKLKISDYLMRSELNVLIRLVHVSLFSWLLLTGTANLLYFLMGIVAYESGNLEYVGATMIVIFFASMFSFVFIALLLHHKMQQVFLTLLYKRGELWNVDLSNDDDYQEGRQRLAQEQLDLFWFGDPSVVISLIQGMQFGYAIALSCLIVFSNAILEQKVVPLYAFFLALAIAYTFFVFVVARVIPRYTLCTSLGQLVDQPRLHETLSEFRLEEAKHEELERAHMAQLQNNNICRECAYVESDEDDISSADSDHSTSVVKVTSQYTNPVFSEKNVGHPVASTTVNPLLDVETITTASDCSSSKSNNKTIPGTAAPTSKPADAAGTAHIMANLVQMETDELRTNLPKIEHDASKQRQDKHQAHREQRQQPRHPVISEGVAALSRISDGLANATTNMFPIWKEKEHKDNTSEHEKADHTKGDAAFKTASIQRCNSFDASRSNGGNVSLLSKGQGLISSAMSTNSLDAPAEMKSSDRQRVDRRQRRQKAVSEGVASMRLTKLDSNENENAISVHSDDNARTRSHSRLQGRTIYTGRGGMNHPLSIQEGKIAMNGDIAELMAQFVSLDTQLLRGNLPSEERELLERREIRKKMRRKSISDGVVVMAGIDKQSHKATLELTQGHSQKELKIKDAVTKEPFLRPTLNTLSLSDSVHAGLDDTSRVQKGRGMKPGRRRKAISEGVASMSFAKNEMSVPDNDKSLFAFTKSAAAKNSNEWVSSNVLSVHPQDSTAGSPSPRLLQPIFAEHVEKPPVDTTGNGKVASQNWKSSWAMKSTGTFDTEAAAVAEVNTKNAEVTKMSKDQQHKSEDVFETVHDVAWNNLDSSDHTVEDSVFTVGGRSDCDDVPEVSHPCMFNVPGTHVGVSTRKERLRLYYLSKQYVLVSNVFGTMSAFFLIGERIERFLVSVGIVRAEEFVTLGFSLKVIFWILFSEMIIFLVSTALILYVLGPFGKLKSLHERKVFVAAVLDGLLSGVCFILFVVAETRRCCYPSDDGYGAVAGSVRNLAEVQHEIQDESTDSAAAISAVCNCPQFGSRLYSGLGNIEPWTGLIALRVCRQWVARRLLRILDRFVPYELDEWQHKRDSLTFTPLAVFGDHSNKHSLSLEHEHGTICDLWQKAVGKYPMVVAEYGEFSGELLRAMLGLPVLAPSKLSSAADGNNVTSQLNAKDCSKSYELSDKFTDLPPLAQEIIVAGQLGQAVKPVTEDDTALRSPKETCTKSGCRRSSVVFKIDESSCLSINEESVFAFPNARLVRSMRRCDRKLLPIINQWQAVDVVMTRFEIVYLDAVDVDCCNVDEHIDDRRQAIVAMKGGKGLRLCDVANERRVVGHLLLSDIVRLQVERLLPRECEVEERDESMHDDLKTEYWDKRDGLVTGSRSLLWTTAKQDTLMIQDLHGTTLCLRFYSDLEYDMFHVDRTAASVHAETEDHLYKNNALQWVQTIARFCVREQLKQPLPHFGDVNEELRDFLVIKTDERRVPNHRRTQSMDHQAKANSSLPGNINKNLSNINADSTVEEGRFRLNRVNSMNFLSTESEILPKPRVIKRAKTFGERTSVVDTSNEVGKDSSIIIPLGD